MTLMSNKNNNRTTHITVRFYLEDPAPMTFMQNLREIGPAMAIAFLFMGVLVASAAAFAGIVTMLS